MSSGRVRDRARWIAQLRAKRSLLSSNVYNNDRRGLIDAAIAALSCPERTSFQGVRLKGKVDETSKA